jgi:hypothetical protein
MAKKKTVTKKTSSAKAAPQAKAKLYSSIGDGAKQYKGLQTRRPPNNPDMPLNPITTFQLAFGEIKADLEDYAANLRSLDRKRLNGVGMKTQGFIKRAYGLAFEKQEVLPH